MMSFKLTIEIECGETTCAKKPGEFCSYMGTGGFGTRWYCTYPWIPGSSEPIRLHEDEKGGWIQRCSACLNAEAGVK